MIREWWEPYGYHVGLASGVLVPLAVLSGCLVAVGLSPSAVATGLAYVLGVVALRIGLSVVCWRQFHPEMDWATYDYEHHDEELGELLRGNGPVERSETV